MPKVSVIMGVFNTPIKYVEKSINSILNQDYKDFEFIICNDGCTDNTFEFIKEKYACNEKVVLIDNGENKGLAYTLNHCLEHAKGKYIARMDADDFSHNNRLREQVKILDNNTDIDLVNCNVNVFDDRGIYGERIYNEIIKKEDFLKNNPIVHPAVMFRKQEIEKVGGYRDLPITLRNEDYDLFMRMYAIGTKMYTLQEKVFDFRENNDSYKRRKYKYRINEFLVRLNGFKKLKLLPKGIVYAVKPLIVGLIPIKLIKRMRDGD